MTGGQLYWTPERRAPLVALRRQGMRPSEIAAQLAITTDRVKYALSQEPQEERRTWPLIPGDNSHPVPSPERLARQKRVLALRKAGLTYVEVAAALGVTKNAVAGMLHRVRLREGQMRQEPPPERVMPVFGCRWIEGDPREPGWSYCGAAVMPGTAWCPEHHGRIYLHRTLRTIEELALAV